MKQLRQPTIGITATVLVMVVALLFISLFSWPSFSGWVSTYLMCTIPASIVIGVIWGPEYPSSKPFRTQPLRGLLLLLIALGVGAVVAAAHFVTVGGGISAPLPMFTQCIIVSVVVTFFMTIVWGGWPFTLIPNKLLAGLSLLVGCYLVNYLLFRTFFDYDFLAPTPLYHAELDPNGLFDAWSATAFAVTCLTIMFVLLHLDLWPFTRVPALMKQPVLGMVWTIVALALGAGLFALGTNALGMPAPTFMVRVPIPFIFGSIVVLNMLGGSLFDKVTQPLKGVLGALTAAVLGTALSLLYAALEPLVSGPLAAGAPAFESEIWLASALLAVTFPFMAYYTDFFGMWPLRKAAARIVEPDRSAS